MKKILEAFQLSKRFGRTVVLEGLEMSVPEGSIYGLLGPNGAGKSTTLQILMNIHQPSSGRAEVFGRDSRWISPQDFMHIGYVSENQEMPDWDDGGKFHGVPPALLSQLGRRLGQRTAAAV